MIFRTSDLKWSILPIWLVILLVLYLHPVKAEDEPLAESAKNFVISLTNDALKSLTVAGITKKERRERFRALMLEKFAFKVIAKWVLGRYWRKASEKEKAEYLTLFEDLMVVTYADRFE